MLPPLPRCPRPLVAAFLLIGSLGSFVFGRELAVVAHLAPAPLSAQLSELSVQRSDDTTWGPLALVVGALGVAPPSLHPSVPPSVHPPSGSTHQRGARAPSSSHPRVNLSIPLPLTSGHGGTHPAKQEKGEQDASEQRDEKHDGAKHAQGNRDKRNQDAGNQDEGNHDDGRGKASPWKADTQAPDGQQVSGRDDSQQGEQGDQGD